MERSALLLRSHWSYKHGAAVHPEFFSIIDEVLFMLLIFPTLSEVILPHFMHVFLPRLTSPHQRLQVVAAAVEGQSHVALKQRTTSTIQIFRYLRFFFSRSWVQNFYLNIYFIFIYLFI